MNQVSPSNTSVLNLSFEDTKIAFASKNNFQLNKSYWIFAIMNLNWLTKLGTFFIKLFLFLHFPIKKLIKASIFEQFCGGESIEACNSTIKNLSDSQIGTILDFSVEREENQKSFRNTKDEILLTIQKANTNPTSIPFAVFKITGIFNSELLEKYQAEETLDSQEIANFEESKTFLMEICQLSADLNVRLFIDAEESWIQNSIDELSYEMMAKFNKETAIIYNTYQMYRTDMLENLILAHKKSNDHNYFLGVKLVRGAYIEKERQRAHEEEYSEPIHKEKIGTDKDFNLGLRFCVENLEKIHFCVGTHNEESCLLLCQLMNEKGIANNNSNIYFAQLLGMSDNVSYNLAAHGYNVAKYVPYGPVSAVMPYLFRRAEENSSIAGQTSREFALLKKEVSRRKNNEK